MDLKYWRQTRRLSIKDLSEKSEVPIRTIEDIEKRGSCKIETAKKLAEALNINLYDLAATDEFYSGPYAHIDLSVVITFLFEKMQFADFKLLLEDINTYHSGIHIRAMNKAYQLYEDIFLNGIDKVDLHWEKTLPR